MKYMITLSASAEASKAMSENPKEMAKAVAQMFEQIKPESSYFSTIRRCIFLLGKYWWSPCTAQERLWGTIEIWRNNHWPCLISRGVRSLHGATIDNRRKWGCRSHNNCEVKKHLLFHLEFIPRENWGPADAPTVHKISVEHLDVIMKSGKVKESGLYADERGGFFIIDVDTPEELLRLLAPLIDVIGITSHPIVSIDTLQKIFQEMTK